MRAVLSPLSSIVVVGLLTARSLAVGPYGQCGGTGYSGSTECDAGYVCSKVNEWYSQCIPGSGPTTLPPSSTITTPTPTISTTSSTAGSSACPNAISKFKFFGVNQSGAEFGEAYIPGTLGKDYTWPSPTSVDYFVNQGFNSFRIPFKLERLSPPGRGLGGAFDQTYLQGLKTIVDYVTRNKNSYAIIEPHNYMRYNSQIITDTNAFGNWWRNLANEFKSNDKVVFDVMNEPHTMDAQVVFNLNQAAVNAIRAAGATTQLILVEGTSWTGAWTWTTSSGNANVFGAIRDPNNNVAIEMHQYLDADGSGTNGTCVSSTIGAERLSAATDWLKRNNLKGFLGELGAGSNSVCISAIKGALCSMQTSGVWIGVAWWAAGPWWGDYFQSIEPPNGPAISQILPQALKPFI